MYKNLIYTHSLSLGEEFELIGQFFLPDIVPEVVAHEDHVHLQQKGFHFSEQSNPNPEHSSPPVHYKYIENGGEDFEGQETRKYCHYPLWGEVVCSHLYLTQMCKQTRHVELYQLGHLEVF